METGPTAAQVDPPHPRFSGPANRRAFAATHPTENKKHSDPENAKARAVVECNTETWRKYVYDSRISAKGAKSTI